MFTTLSGEHRALFCKHLPMIKQISDSDIYVSTRFFAFS